MPLGHGLAGEQPSISQYLALYVVMITVRWDERAESATGGGRDSGSHVKDAPRKVSGATAVHPVLQPGLHRIEVVRTDLIGDLILATLGLIQHSPVVGRQLIGVVFEVDRVHPELVQLAPVETD